MPFIFSWARRVLRLLGYGFALIILSLFFYFLAALLLGLLSVNRDFQAAPDGVDIYIRSNGVHTDLLLPLQAAGTDWRSRLPAQDFGQPDARLSYLAFGWGDRGFYLHTPTWAELTVSTALRALSGMERTVLHIEALPQPQPSAEVRRVRISAQQLQQLARYIDASFERNAKDGVKRIEGVAYGSHDAFYEAKGSYSVLFTCNEWVRRALSQAGIRTTAWAPFSSAIFYHLPASE